MADERSMIREGVVSIVYPERCSCRVRYEDRDDLISAEMPILQPAGAKNKFYSLPDVGDVVCVLAASNDNSNTGWVVGSRFHDKCEPPEKNQDVSMVKFGDGSFIKYDRAKHEMRIKCVGKIYIDGKEIHLNG